jgi:hypothetical protein
VDRYLSRHRSQTSRATIPAGELLNHIEAQFTTLRCFTLDGTDHTSHAE